MLTAFIHQAYRRHPKVTDISNKPHIMETIPMKSAEAHLLQALQTNEKEGYSPTIPWIIHALRMM